MTLFTIAYIALILIVNSCIACPIELTLKQLGKEDVCHTTASKLEENFKGTPLSTPRKFYSDMIEEYWNYLNDDQAHDALIYNKLNVSVFEIEGNKHDFIILRKDNTYQILHSMVGAFTLGQWLQGDSSYIDSHIKTSSDCKEMISKSYTLNCRLSEKQLISLKRGAELHEDLKTIKYAFENNCKQSLNKPVSSTVFNEDFLPRIFTCLNNTDDDSSTSFTSTPRKYIGIKPEYTVFLSAQKKRI